MLALSGLYGASHSSSGLLADGSANASREVGLETLRVELRELPSALFEASGAVRFGRWPFSSFAARTQPGRAHHQAGALAPSKKSTHSHTRTIF